MSSRTGCFVPQKFYMCICALLNNPWLLTCCRNFNNVYFTAIQKKENHFLCVRELEKISAFLFSNSCNTTISFGGVGEGAPALYNFVLTTTAPVRFFTCVSS